MKKTSLIILVIAASFLSGFAFKTAITNQKQKLTTMKKKNGHWRHFFQMQRPQQNERVVQNTFGN